MGSVTVSSWQQTASEKQKAVLDSIPAKWRLKQSIHGMKDVRNVPRDCGLLTDEQLAITEKTTTELVEDLAKRRLSSVEVTEAFCARAAVAHQCVNCLTALYYEEAMGRARELDEILNMTGKLVGPLHGLPIAIKDIFLVKDKPATFGLVAWADQRGDFDASIVKLLKTAGIVHIASTTMPQTGMMLQTVSPLYGRTLNPFHRDFSAGGSSGGDGSLVAMKGSPFCPSTDIGGSIRAPGAFNGLYAIRPTAERIPKYGMLSPAAGQVSIKVSCGPTCHSVQDLELVTRLLTQHKDYIGYEPTAVSVPWKDVTVDKKLVLAMLKTDGVVRPQPPVLRALSETAAKLRTAGHTVIEIEPPIDLWEAAQVTWRLYFQTGGKEIKALMASTGEPVEKCFRWYQDTFKIKELTVPELFQTNLQQAAIKREFAHFWDSTKQHTSTGRPIDGIICPAAPSASFPHDFMVWWGYFSIWNLLDYPSTIIPLKHFSISSEQDPKDAIYAPKENPFDGLNYDIYDPELWKGLPVSLQIVTQQFGDEELLKVTAVVDDVVNGLRSV